MSIYAPAGAPALARGLEAKSVATWNFYSAGTVAPAIVYADEERNVALGPTVAANGAGRFPDIFLDPKLSYRAILKGRRGETILDVPLVGSPAADDIRLAGFGAGSVSRSVGSKLREIRTFEDFGAVGDATVDGRGSDDTAAIQTAIDWATSEAGWRAILMTPKNFLCSNITTKPGLTIVGTGRHTSAFVCRTGAEGEWWSSRGHGAQKLMLSGIAWYGRHLEGVTHIAKFGGNLKVGGAPAEHEAPFGTEGIISGCWFRDLKNGYGLAIDANVGIVRDVTLQSCKYNLKVLGNANLLSGIICMQGGEGADAFSDAISANLSGCIVDRMEIEATASGALPLRQRGESSISGLVISTPYEVKHSHLIEIDRSVFDEWNLENVQLLGNKAPVLDGIIKVVDSYDHKGVAKSFVYRGGVDAAAFSGASFKKSLDIHSGDFSLKGQKRQFFAMKIQKVGGILRHQIGSQADPETTGNGYDRISGASPIIQTTPVGKGDFVAGCYCDGAGRMILNTDMQSAVDQDFLGMISYENTGEDFTLLVSFESISVHRIERVRPVIQLRKSTTSGGASIPFHTLAEGSTIILKFSGYLA